MSMSQATMEKGRQGNDYLNLDADVYGNLFLRLVQVHDTTISEEEREEDDAEDDPNQKYFGAFPRVVACHALILWVFNAIVQFLIVFVVLLAAEEAEKPLEQSTFLTKYNHTREEFTQALNGAVVMNNQTLPSWFSVEVLALCRVQLVPAFAYSSCLMTLVWCMVMVGEVKECIWFGFYLYYCPNRSKEDIESPRLTALTSARAFELALDDSSFEEGEVSDRFLDLGSASTIVALSSSMKLFGVIVGPGTRLAVAFAATYAGIKYIFVQTSLANAVLKVMTLRFIIKIDELLHIALSSKVNREDLKRAKIYSPGVRTRCCGMSSLAPYWDSLGGMFWMTLSVLIWLIAFCGVFWHEMQFRNACLGYGIRYPAALNMTVSYSISDALTALYF